MKKIRLEPLLMGRYEKLIGKNYLLEFPSTPLFSLQDSTIPS